MGTCSSLVTNVVMVNSAVMGDKDRRITQLLEEIRRMKSEDQLKSEQIRLLLTK